MPPRIIKDLTALLVPWLPVDDVCAIVLQYRLKRVLYVARTDKGLCWCYDLQEHQWSLLALPSGDIHTHALTTTSEEELRLVSRDHVAALREAQLTTLWTSPLAAGPLPSDWRPPKIAAVYVRDALYVVVKTGGVMRWLNNAAQPWLSLEFPTIPQGYSHDGRPLIVPDHHQNALYVLLGEDWYRHKPMWRLCLDTQRWSECLAPVGVDCAATLCQGYMYAAGGRLRSPKYGMTNKLERWQPGECQWMERASSQVARCCGSLVAVDGCSLILLGGHGEPSDNDNDELSRLPVEQYNVGSDTWKTLEQPLPEPCDYSRPYAGIAWL
jgi:hypothetical protein